MTLTNDSIVFRGKCDHDGHTKVAWFDGARVFGSYEVTYSMPYAFRAMAGLITGCAVR